MFTKKNSEPMFHVFDTLTVPVLVAVLALCLIALPRVAWTDYVYTELSAPGMLRTHAHGINNSGTVVGDVDNIDGWNGFLYSGGSYIDMILSGWTETYAFGINNYNEVAGFGNDGTADKAFIYSGGSYTALIPPDWVWAEAYGINDYGDVVGFGNDGTNDRGFLYSGGSYTELLPPGWTESYAYDINNNGDIVGLGHGMGFLYSGGVYTALIPPGWDFVYAWIVGPKINNNGSVVANGLDGFTWKGFVYKDGVYSELFPPGWSYAFINDINDNDIAAGWGNDSAGTGKGFIVDACAHLPVMNADTVTEYTSLQDAYDAAADGNIILTRDISLTEDPLFGLNKSLALYGGYDCGYSVNNGITKIQGNMIISSGRIAIAGGMVALL